jgi:hypothetical protein
MMSNRGFSNDLPVVIKVTPVGADNRNLKVVVRRQSVLRGPKSTIVLACVVEVA